MACEQMQEYLVNGNVINSVNFPAVVMERSAKTRIVIMNNNVAGIVEKITHVLSGKKINISDMINKSRGDVAYNIIDTDQDVDDKTIQDIESVDGIIRVRKI
jgi:D-3-phosphoglycerate dehydrogenase